MYDQPSSATIESDESLIWERGRFDSRLLPSGARSPRRDTWSHRSKPQNTNCTRMTPLSLHFHSNRNSLRQNLQILIHHFNFALFYQSLISSMFQNKNKHTKLLRICDHVMDRVIYININNFSSGISSVHRLQFGLEQPIVIPCDGG